MTSKQLLKKLMAFRAVSADVKAVNRAVDFSRAYLKERGLRTCIEKLDGRKILYASTTSGKKSGVLFNAHLDVVPASADVFRIRERAGWIYGRGAGDCLGNCAVTMNIVSRLVGKADAGLILSTDEESGGLTTRHMVDLDYIGDRIIIMDGGGYRIVVAQKGVFSLKLSAKGKSCHGSTPWRGENAIDRLIDGYQKIRRFYSRAKKDNEWHTTMSANIIHAGTVFNRVPDEAEMVLDIRHTEKDTPAQIARRIRTTSGLKVQCLRKQPIVFCDAKHPDITTLQTLMQKRLRRKINIVRMNGATDARHFVKLKIPIIIMGVPGKGAHSDGEGVSIKGLKRYEDMLTEYCLEG